MKPELQHQPGQCSKSIAPKRRSRDLLGRKRKNGRKENRRHVRPQLSLGNGRFGAWNAGAVGRLHPASQPHRRGLRRAAALPSCKQNKPQKHPTREAKNEEKGIKRRVKKIGRKNKRKKAGEGENKENFPFQRGCQTDIF